MDTTNAGSPPGVWSRVLRPAVLVSGLILLVLFWVTLMLSDTAVSPIAFIDVPDGTILTLTALHVVSAFVSWIVATLTALAARRIGQILVAILAVPFTAVVTLLVLMTDATVWRNDIGAWVGPMILALSGPIALGSLLGWSLASLRSQRRHHQQHDSKLPPPAPPQGPPVTITEVPEPGVSRGEISADAAPGQSMTSDVEPSSPSQRRRRGIVAAIAGGLILGLVAVGTLIGSTQTWEWVDDGRSLASGRDVFATAVAAGGPGFVVIGEALAPVRQIMVWTSTDGRSWQRASGDDAFGSPDERVTVHDVVGTPEGVIAVGSVSQGVDEGGQTLPAIWSSQDGHTWHRSLLDHHHGIARSVVTHGSAIVAVGSSDSAAAIWFSTDGTSWQRIANAAFQPDLPRTTEGPEPSMSLVSVTAGGPGFVAVGENSRLEQPGLLNDADIRAVVFTSTDGTEWTRVPHDAEIFGGLDRHRMTSVIAGGSGLVAVGYQPPRGPVAWTSSDGLTWQRHPIDDRNLRDVRLVDIARVTHPLRDAGTLVAVGQDWGPFTASRRDIVAVVVSQDGVRWHRDTSRVLTTGRGHQVVLDGVAASEQGVVAVGSIMGAAWDGVDATVWFAPASSANN